MLISEGVIERPLSKRCMLKKNAENSTSEMKGNMARGKKRGEVSATGSALLIRERKSPARIGEGASPRSVSKGRRPLTGLRGKLYSRGRQGGQAGLRIEETPGKKERDRHSQKRLGLTKGGRGGAFAGGNERESCPNCARRVKDYVRANLTFPMEGRKERGGYSWI